MSLPAERLKPLVDLAGVEGHEAALRLAQSQAEVVRAERELERISQYLGEYRLPATGAVSSGRLQSDRAFLSRLAELVEVQAARLATVRERHESIVIEWQQAHRRDQALNKLYEKYLYQALADADRRQQESMDELLVRWLDGN